MSYFGTIWQKTKLAVLGFVSPQKKLQIISQQQLRHEQQIIARLKGRRLPSWRQLMYLPKVLSRQERKTVSHLLFLIVFCFLVIVFNLYIEKSQTIPAVGGEYAEALIGYPRFINPVLARSSDADTDLSHLIYSGLMKYDSSGKLTNDLAAAVSISADQKEYTLKIKSGIKWQDNYPFSVNDIIFTFSLIQDPQVKSPLLRTFKNVTLEKIDDETIKFILKYPFAPFLNTLTFGILPQHLWENISLTNLQNTDLDLRPIGTGPWKFKALTKDKDANIKTYSLVPNENYYGQKPYLQKIIFKFYSDYLEAIDSLKNNSIKGLSYVPLNEYKNLKKYKNLDFFNLLLPQYTAAFFNLRQNSLLQDRNIRKALNLAVDKEKILREVLIGNGNLIASPILPGQLGYNKDLETNEYSLSAAETTLENAGWKKQADGFRQKKKQLLELNLTTGDQAENIAVANLLKQFWEAAGAKINLTVVPKNLLAKEVIKPRFYDILLISEVVGSDPDPYSFWYSTESDPPGLNLSGYASRTADSIISDARQTTDQNIRAKKYQEFQTIIAQDLPAVFLYSLNHTYVLDQQIKGFKVSQISTPADRFNNLSDWYIKTKKKFW